MPAHHARPDLLPVREKDASDRALGWGIIKPAHCPCIKATGQNAKWHRCAVPFAKIRRYQEFPVALSALTQSLGAEALLCQLMLTNYMSEVRAVVNSRPSSLVSRLKNIDMFVHNSLHIPVAICDLN